MKTRERQDHSHVVVAPVLQVSNYTTTTSAKRTLNFQVPSQNFAIAAFSRCCVASREHIPQSFVKSTGRFAQFREVRA